MMGLLMLALVGVVAAERPTECPTEQEIDWFIDLLLRHDDCDKFNKCPFGQRIVQQCPNSNLCFNLDPSKCDWRENVDNSDRNVPGEFNREYEPDPEPPEPEPDPQPEPGPEPEPGIELEHELRIGIQVQVPV